MALRQTKKISELPALSPASLDTTFVVGISGSTTYKISINNLTSSLDTTFATDLVTSALSNTLDTKLSTSSFNSYTASISTGSLVTSISNLNIFTASVTTASIVTSISNLNTFTASLSTASLVTSISNLNTFTASQSTSSLVDRLNTIESVSGSWITESETGSFLTSLNGAISGSSQLTSSFDQRYVISGSITQTTWDNIASKPVGIVSSSTQISDLGFVTGSYTTINSFNSLTQSFNSISQSFNVISGSVGTIDFSTLATTASNTFIGNQTISGSTYISGGLDIKNNGYSWSFDSNGKTRIPNIIFNSDRGTGMVGIKPVAGREFQIETSTAESSAGPWVFGLDGTLSAPNGANILRVGNLVTTASFNSYTASQTTSSLVDRLNTIESVSGSWITESETGSFLTSLSGAISSSSQLTSSYDNRYVISGSITHTTWDNIANKPFGIVSQSTDLTPLNNFTASISTASLVTSISNLNTFTASQSTSSLVNRLNAIESVSGSWITESETGSFLTSLSGAISSSSQLTSSYDTRYTLSGSVSAVPSGTISGSSQLTSSYDARYTLSSSFSSISSSFNSRFNGLVTTGSNTFSGSQIFSGSMVVTSGQIIASAITNNSSSLFLQSGSNLYVQNNGLVEITGSLNSTSITGSIAATNGVISGSTQLTTAFPSKTTGAWSVPAGASTQSFTVESGASYTMWVNGNIPNGIITWNATVTTSNTNVPVVGSQYGWYYTAGNALVLTAMPDQIIGTTNTLISSPTSYAPNTSNVFKFGITNNSGTTQTINYGYIKLS